MTEKRRLVFKLISEGWTVKEIAHKFKKSVKTIEYHKAQAMVATGCKGTSDITRYALIHGLTTLDPVPLLQDRVNLRLNCCLCRKCQLRSVCSIKPMDLD